tara:strand:+ start:456 stop:1247 length:792 start_codon:yes stop_codon:yes gene_type:complete
MEVKKILITLLTITGLFLISCSDRQINKDMSDTLFRVDRTLTQTVNDKTVDNMDRYDEFEMRAKNNPAKIGQWNDLAQELKWETTVVYNLIDSIRYELWKSGGPTIEGKPIKITDEMESNKSLFSIESSINGYELIDKANKNYPKIIMLGSDGSGGAGVKLKNALSDYREYLLNLDLYTLNDTSIQNMIRSMLDTSDYDDGTKDGISWEEYQYRDIPLVGVLTFLNQTKLDVGTTEDMILELLEKRISTIVNAVDTVLDTNTW